MFKTAYGSIEVNCHVSLQRAFRLKSIDTTRSIEVFCIGSVFGETDFSGLIYLLKWNNNNIPFIVSNETTIAEEKIGAFRSPDLESFHTSGTKTIRITKIEISNSGIDLQSIKRGPRGTVNYSNCFPPKTSHGYIFSNSTEEHLAREIIAEALPIIYFDSYEIMGSSPSICVEISFSPSSKTLTEEQVAHDLATKLVKRFTKIDKDCVSLEDVLEYLITIPPHSDFALERIDSFLIDVERQIFIRGMEEYPFGVWEHQGFLDILRRIYDSHFRTGGQTFEVFAVHICCYLKDRVFARILYEQSP